MLLLLLVLSCQTGQVDASELTLDTAIELALEHSPVLKQAALSVALAHVDVQAESWWLHIFPDMSITPLRQDFEFEIVWDMKEMLAANWTMERARLHWLDAQAYEDRIRQQVVLDVTQKFLSWELAKEQVRLSEGKFQRNAKLVEISRLKFQEGMTELDTVLQAEYGAVLARMHLLTAQMNLQLRELALKQAMGEKKP